jgi:hypothetical protein
VKESITLCHVLEAQDVPYAQACTVEASDDPEWPGDPLFENPFAKTDPNYCAVAPYFEMQNRHAQNQCHARLAAICTSERSLVRQRSAS